MSQSDQRRAFRKVLIKGLFLCLPFGLLAGALVVIDPFNYFGLFDCLGGQVKEKTSGRLHYTLWKTVQYQRHPMPNILLGDSRMAAFSVDEIEEVSGIKYFNFGFGGGTVPEAIDSFWFAADKVQLEEVYIAIGFLNFNSYQNMNRFPESKAMLENPALYLTNRIVFQAALYNVRSAWEDQIPDIERPQVTNEEFWQQQLGPNTKALYGNYRYPEDYVEKLREIGTYCQQHQIQLRFIIPPTHVDLQQKIAEFGLAAENERFLRDLQSIAPVIDFDFPNDFNSNRENFPDPYHPGPKRRLINAIWGTSDRELIRTTDNMQIEPTSLDKSR